MESEQREFRWGRRPLPSAAIRVSLAAVPAAVIVAFALFVVRATQRGGGHVDVLAWLLVTSLFTLGVLLAFEAVAGRLRTLGALLDISMEFPYEPPSRLSVAMTSPYHVELTTELDGVRGQLRRHRRGGDDADSAAAHLDRVESILTLAAITGTLEPGTRHHSHRVAQLADQIGLEMHLDRDRRRWLRWAALLHDVGKLTVPGEVLHKPAALTGPERRIVRQHVTNGARIIKPLIPLLGPWSRAVGEHHERWDGKGYPLGLKGEEISLAGRIVAVADTYATMTKGRIYQRRSSAADGLRELEAQTGGQFDPDIVEAFARSWRRHRSPRILARLPAAAAGSLASVWASLGLPAASSAATLGLVGAVVAVAVTAPAVARVLPPAPGTPIGSIQEALGAPAQPTPVQAALPSPSLRPASTATPRPLPSTVPVQPPSPSPVPVVRQAAPAIDLSPASSVVEGVLAGFDGRVTSPGTPARVHVSFGDGTPAQTLTLSNDTFHVAHVYVDEGPFALRVDASGDGGSSQATSNVTVAEYTATVSLPRQATAGSLKLTVDGSVTDPSADTLSAFVDYGEGQGVQPLALNGRDFTLSHTYSSAGSYPVTVMLQDDDGPGPVTQVTVDATAPPSG